MTVAARAIDSTTRARHPAITARLEQVVAERDTPQLRQWLADLPDILDQLTLRWMLRDLAAHPEAQRSVAARAVSAQYGPVILKIERPDSPPGAAHALLAWSGSGAPMVYLVEPKLRAYLIAAVPDVPTPSNWRETIDVTAEVARVLGHGHRKQVEGLPGAAQVTTARVETARARLARIGGDPGFDPALLGADATRAAMLPSTGLLHGDLTPRNVLLDLPRVNLIDPEPLSGPLEWDLAYWAARFGHPEGVAAHWAAMRAVLDLDEDLFRWLVAAHTRTHIAYLRAFDRAVPPPLLHLAQTLTWAD